jgi:type IV secretory pathway TraG/TraD family ATPase VirD4
MPAYRDPLIAANTACSDWRIADLMTAERPVSLYLAVPPSDISRTRPLVRLILNQIARRLTETLPEGQSSRRQLLLMLDEFPALGRLEFFETSLAFMAGYGVRAFLVAQSLNQIDRAYGVNHAILDNCHVRVAFAPNDERTARRLSEALGTAMEIRHHGTRAATGSRSRNASVRASKWDRLSMAARPSAGRRRVCSAALTEAWCGAAPAASWRRSAPRPATPRQTRPRAGAAMIPMTRACPCR